MTYAIFTVYYGVPLDPDKRGQAALILAENDPDFEDVADADDSDLRGYLEEYVDGMAGFHREYDGSASDYPMAFGVELDGFDECEHHIELSSLKLQVTDDQKAQYQKQYDALQPEYKKVVDVFGEPRVFFLVSSS
jgi:hypothetical protein